MAINENNNFMNKIGINVEAEKIAFSEKIQPPETYRDMAKPTEDIKISSLASDFTKPNSFSPFTLDKEYMGTQKDAPIKLESEALKFDQSTNFNLSNQSSLMTGLDELKNLNPVSSLLASQQLMTTSLNQQTGLNPVDINKQVNKILNSSVTPALENMSQYVQQMSSLNTDHKNVHDELPTISPTNLAFVDRSSTAMDKPGWA